MRPSRLPLCLLVLAVVAAGQASAKASRGLDNAQVEAMLQAGVPAQTVALKIEFNPGPDCALDSSPDALEKLAKDGVPENVLTAVATSRCHPAAPAGPVAPAAAVPDPPPEPAPAVPAGATAICRDGTYSFSLHRQGTCSHHGGVASWLGGQR